ncbi:hypothetical protein HPT27_15965 [Permianibacter sp. IMCC34836]|uniref:hypothetical protein n=1 Tax=Permianibacter fluminis TaxID=2738515 RepID=UPI0015555430|nr:hypothetical protein [Permianibacter fluminis]NQD38519.1 hypothetical protein [Permianibacter fluminis]
MKRWLVSLLAGCSLLFGSTVVLAEAVAVPEALKPWRDWALHGEEFRRCPLSHGQEGDDANDFACVWYGSLRLDADSNGARFSLPIEVLGGRETAVVLPGDRDRWPRNLSDGVHALPVVERNGLPVLLLGPGKLTVSGEFRWRELPGNLALPASLVLIDLRLNGRAVPQPQRESNALVLATGPTQATVQDTVQLRVYQRLQDGLPLQLETVLLITATGSAREVVLGKPLQEGFVPTAMTSKLAARLDEQGLLHLQLRAGDWQLTLQSRAEKLPTELSVRAENGLWPSEAIWSWQSSETLRAASLEGGAPIDPVQADVPEAWQQLPALRVRAGETLYIAERSRGRQVTDNALQLNRQLWLRFDGSTYAFRDQIDGTLRSDWRLDMAAPYQLMQVSEAGTALPISSLTADSPTATTDRRGIELRTGNISLQASGELVRNGAMPATGWQNRFDSAQLQLHLPPGYRLLAAQGVDSAPDSFLERWNLLDTFVLVLTAVLIYKLYGVLWSLLMLVGFAILYHEPDMPIWLLPNAALALLACRYASGKLLVWLSRYRALSLAALLLILVPFFAGQISALLHPQLEARDGAYYGGYGPVAAEQVQYEAASPAPAEPRMKRTDVESEAPTLALRREEGISSSRGDEAMEQRIEVTGSRIRKSDLYQTYSDNSISQAGNGIPAWQWRSYSLQWSGPVDANQELSLWILPYSVRVLVILAAIAIFAGWFLRIARELTGVQALRFAREKLGLAVVLLLLMPALAPQPAQADIPSPELLEELKTRLLTPPVCAPNCADVESVTVRASREQIDISLEINALVPTAVPVPGRAGDWLPVSVSRDGERSVARLRGSAVQVWLPAGKHRLQLSGPTSGSDRVTLAFPLKPRRIDVQLDGWEASGLQLDTLPSGALALTRSARFGKEANATDKAGTGVTQLSVPPFVRVERTLSFADEWRVDTRVIRVAPAHGAFTLQLPLLAGEAVQDNTLKAEAGLLQLDFAGSEDSKSFSSTLARAEQLQLLAPESAPYVEIWQLAPDNQWRVATEGTPQIANEDGADWLQTFAPRPGEKLTVTISRPTILAGATLAIDNVTLQHEQGLRGGNGSLMLKYRATQGGEQALRLPADIELNSLQLDGREQTMRPREGVLTVPVLPGEHSLTLSYRDHHDVSWQQGVPAIALGLPAANIQYSLTMPDNRWILFTSGPRLGPAVLYWSALLVFVALAFVLARSGLTALPFRDWLLLGLGLSTVSWWVLALLVSWFVALRWRERQVNAPTSSFNLKQVVLFGLSIVAVLVLVGSVPAALLSSPDMMLTGNGSYGNQLNWFADYSSNELPGVSVLSAPMWLYKGAMLLWAIWLSFALLRWVKLAWTALQVGGLWQHKPIKPVRASVGGEPAGTAAVPATVPDAVSSGAPDEKPPAN